MAARWGLIALAAPGPLAAQSPVVGREAVVRLGGRLHTQYATSSIHSSRDQFSFRRARIEADITVNGFLDARLQPEFGGGVAELRDAYVRLTFDPALQVTLGQFKRPFDLFELSSSADLSLIERDGRVGGVSACGTVGGTCSYSRLTERLGFADRDIGLRVGGTRGGLGYEVSLTNGAGANQPDENHAKSFTGRVAWALGGGWVAGLSAASHDFVDGPAARDARARVYGADVQFGQWRDGLLVQASLVRGGNWREPGVDGDPEDFLAAQGVASFYARFENRYFAGLEPLLRVSYADPSSEPDDRGWVMTPGLMMYVKGRSKVGTNLDVWIPETGRAEHSLKIQAFLYF